MRPGPRGSLALSLISVIAIALAQLACSLAAGMTSTPGPVVPGTEETTPTSLPARQTGAVPTEPAIATAQAPGLPDRPLSQTGPWYVFMAYAAEHEVWALNGDGSGLTKLWSYLDEDASPTNETFTLWPAPSGGRVAILQFDRSLQTGPLLRLLQLPSGKMQTIADLLPRAIDYGALGTDARSAATQVWAAVGPKNSLAWSSDGRWLAFNASIDGPSADVYVYDTSTSRVARLTDGPDQSTNLTWSPDDRYIVHSVVRSLYYGYSGLGYDMLGAWAVPPDPAKSAIHLYDHAFHGFEYVLGWLDDHRYLADALDGDSLGNCGYFDLRTVDIQSGEGPSLLKGNYTWRAFDPQTGMMLLVVSPVLKEFNCGATLQTGVYLFDTESRKARLLPDIVPDPIMGVTWSPQAGLFFLGGEADLIAVNPEGAVSRFPSIPKVYDNPPVVAPGGDTWALESGPLDATLAVGTRTGDLLKVDVPDAQSPFWSLDGSWLFFFDGLRLYAAASPRFAPATVVGEMLSPQGPVLVDP